jgi:hypothetical protein
MVLQQRSGALPHEKVLVSAKERGPEGWDWESGQGQKGLGEKDSGLARARDHFRNQEVLGEAL